MIYVLTDNYVDISVSVIGVMTDENSPNFCHNYLVCKQAYFLCRCVQKMKECVQKKLRKCKHDPDSKINNVKIKRKYDRK